MARERRKMKTESREKQERVNNIVRSWEATNTFPHGQNVNTHFVQVRDLIDKVNLDGQTALRCAILRGSVECVKTLLQFGVRVNVTEDSDMASLEPSELQLDATIKKPHH